MLKLTVEIGESLLIGDDIKVVFTGGTSNYARVLVEAPKSLPIVRSSLVEKQSGGKKGQQYRYKKERDLSPEAKARINAILAEERRRVKKENQ